MAQVFGLQDDHCDPLLRQSLQQSLRVYDECVVLPQAHQSSESGAFKNIVVGLNGSENGLNPDIFSPNWFSGISGIEIPAREAEMLLRDPVKRAAALKTLADAIPTEFGEADTIVGPELECDEHDRDLNDWNPGFDSPGCCVGLYSASQYKNPDPSKTGISRPHKIYYLICKAGAGIAAQTFHSRISASLKKGLSLEEALSDGNSPGAQALRRVSLGAQRNRARILCLAADALGLHSIDTLNDTACPVNKSYRVAVTSLNVVTNSIQKIESNLSSYNSSITSKYQYFGGCVDSQTSQGVVSASNVAEGFLLFSDSENGCKINVKNGAFNAVPFSSIRIKSNRDAVMECANHMKDLTCGDASQAETSTHVDREWIQNRFSWTGRDFGIQMEPPALLGTYDSESFSTQWCRELGLSKCRPVRLEPEIVSISATEPAKLRAAAKHVLGSVKPSKKK